MFDGVAAVVNTDRVVFAVPPTVAEKLVGLRLVVTVGSDGVTYV